MALKKEIQTSKKSTTPLQAQQPKSLIELSIDERHSYLENVYKVNIQQLEESSPSHVSEMLSVCAAMIQCPIPPQIVITKYIEILCEYPPDLIDIAGREVIKKHKWNNFPKVAEFIDEIKELYFLRKETKRKTEEAIGFWKNSSIRTVGTSPPSRGRGPRSLSASLPKMENKND